MEDSAFSDEFCRFIQTTVPSVSAAELLVVLLQQPDRWWDVPEIARAQLPGASISEGDARKYLDLLVAHGAAATGPDDRYQYRPASAELDALVRTLSQAYNERPVTLIRMIYALRDTKIRSFADAFKIRKD